MSGLYVIVLFASWVLVTWLSSRLEIELWGCEVRLFSIRRSDWRWPYVRDRLTPQVGGRVNAVSATDELPPHRARTERALWWVVVAWLLCMPLATAGEYTLTQERIPQRPLDSFTLCRDLEENLNRFKDEPPMVCGIRVHPSMTQFDRPDWEPLEPREHMDILKAIAHARDAHLTEEQQVEKWAANRQTIEAGEARLLRARFDISNSGREVIVLRHDLWGCSPENELNFADARLPGLAVVSEKQELHQDYALLHKGSRSYADVFFHEGRTYISRWWGDLNFENGSLEVYDPFWVRERFGYDHRPLCQISHTPDQAKQ